MRQILRSVLPLPVKKWAKRILGIPPTTLHRDGGILSLIGPAENPHVVLDVGARHGWFFHYWQDWCPEARVHAFEPAPDAYKKLMKNYGRHPSVKVNPVGVGDSEGDFQLNVLSKSQVSNSFLSCKNETWQEIQFETGVITTKTVPVITLDRYCPQEKIESIYLLKIDVQGSELKVLRGAISMLKRTDYVFVEAGIVPFYEGAPLFTDVYEFLHTHGFHLITLRAWHRGNHKLMETDMLFRHDNLLPSIDTSLTRVVEELKPAQFSKK